MKLEIDIPSILYNDAKENRGYISVNKMEIAWKAIADGKPIEQEPTTKNNLGVDCISRQAVLNLFNKSTQYSWEMSLLKRNIEEMPSVIPQEPFINKPCVSEKQCEHDKNVALDKIRAEIAEYGSIMVAYAITKDTKTDKGIEKLVSGVLKQAKEQVLQIIDKYKAESEKV